MTQFTRRASLAPRPMTRLTGFRHALQDLSALLKVWRHRARSRKRLADLPPSLLRDIGVTQEAAEREAAKPFWR